MLVAIIVDAAKLVAASATLLRISMVKPCAPTSTTFNYQNTDPQTGAIYRDTVQDFGRTILFANQIGVFGLYGGAVIRVSAKLDTLFSNAIFPGNAAGTPCLMPTVPHVRRPDRLGMPKRALARNA